MRSITHELSPSRSCVSFFLVPPAPLLSPHEWSAYGIVVRATSFAMFQGRSVYLNAVRCRHLAMHLEWHQLLAAFRPQHSGPEEFEGAPKYDIACAVLHLQRNHLYRADSAFTDWLEGREKEHQSHPKYASGLLACIIIHSLKCRSTSYRWG